MTGVIRKNRVIKDRWSYGFCAKCGHNPRRIKMVNEVLVSGDPLGKHKSEKEIWVCPRCGFSRKL
jgi:NMD protein affecting ribosome stability and mRNA decay